MIECKGPQLTFISIEHFRYADHEKKFIKGKPFSTPVSVDIVKQTRTKDILNST